MDRRRFELATIAASRALSCTYCLAAHSKFLRDVVDDDAVRCDPDAVVVIDREVAERVGTRRRGDECQHR